MDREQMLDELADMGADVGVIDAGVSDELIAEWLRSMLMHTDAARNSGKSYAEVGRVRRFTSRFAEGDPVPASYAEVQRLERYHDRAALGESGIAKTDLVTGFQWYKGARQGGSVERYLERF